MKINCKKLIGLFFSLSLSVSLFAQQYGQALKEDFENGIPNDWTQEIVSDQLSWTVESGDLDFPNGAFTGEKRVAFRNVSGVTKNASARLVSPIMDLSKMYRPLLVFAHAQNQWTKDVDKLRVLYRLSPESNWVELKVYDECITFWQVDTIKLVGSSQTYQIAFEATDNLGRGVVLDNVEVRSTPKCDTPYDLMVTELTSKSAVLNWLGAFDAKGFELKVSTERITPEQLNDKFYVANVKDTLLGKVWDYKLTSLESGTKYYYYLRSNCKNEISDWAIDSFQVVGLMTVPYFNNFNMKKTSAGIVSVPDQWVVSASNAAKPPFVNTCLYNNFWQFSLDSTYALCFYGSNEVEKPTSIRGGVYAYACMPEAEVDDISKLTVSFTAINYNPHLSDRFGIIVGVMTDPNDKTTFVAVDTVDVKSMRMYEECEVSLKNYAGKGKFIAFMSDFVESNIFCMDNLKVDYTPTVMKVNDFKVSLLTSTSMKFDFALEYPKYEVVVAKEKLLNANIDAAIGVVRSEISNHGTISGLENNINYYIYARAIDGANKGEWSRYKLVRTPGKIATLPYTETFTINIDDKDSYYYANHGEFESLPKCMMPKGLLSLSGAAFSMTCDDKTCSEETSGELTFGPTHDDVSDPEKHLHASLGLTDYDLWAITVFPELPVAINSVAVSFVAKNSHKEHLSAVEVGVMSMANDASTFQPIDTIKLSRTEKKYIYNLDEYNVKGQFWAFRVDSKLVKSDKNVVCIDDVRFYSVPTCKSPSNVELMSVPGDPTKMTLKWDANGANSWIVRLSRDEYPIDSMFSETQNYEYVYNNTINTNSITFTDLRPSGFKYYYTICPICGTDKGNWTLWDSLTTNCYDRESIPYVENFDNDDYLVGYVEGFAVPCMISNQLIYKTSVLLTSPCLSNEKSVSGSNSLELSKGKRFEDNLTPYFALPKMAKPLKELQLSFKTFGKEVQPPIWVGVMTDPFDTTTFTLVDVVTPIVLEKENENDPDEFLEYIVSFANYKGTGEHIALMLKDENEYMHTSIYIDDIVVDNLLPCARPEKIKLVDYNYNSVKLSWTTPKDINQWRVLFAKEKLTQQDLANPQLSDIIVKIETGNLKDSWFTGLEASTRYYVYVQSMCSDVETSKWSNYFTFTTLCQPLNIEAAGVESFENYGTGIGTYPDCYVVGSKSRNKEFTPYCDTKYKHSGQASMIIKSDEDYNGAYLITNALNVDDIATVKLNFWGYTDNPSDRNAHSVVVGVLTTPSDLATFVPIDTLDFSSEERPYEVNFHKYKYDYAMKRGKFIMFLSEFDKPNTIYIDDISFAPASKCPTTFYFSEITATSFKLNFESDNAPYEIKYSTSMCDEDLLNSDELPSFVVTGNSLELTNLLPYTTYYFYGRSTCDGVYGDWSSVNIVRTNCYETLPLPYFDNFDNQVAVGQSPDCWDSYYQEDNVAYPALDAMSSALTTGIYPHSGQRAVYLRTETSAPSYLVSKEIEVDNLNKCQVSFFALPKNAGMNNSLVVGVVEDVDSIASSFVAIDTIFINQEIRVWEEIVVSFAGYTGTSKRIAFVSYHSLNEGSSRESGVYVDDVLIEIIPTCAKPKQFKFVSHSENSITLSFVGSASNYEAVYGTPGFDVNTATDIVEFSGNEFTLTGLSVASYYDVYVRAVCSASDKSPWTYAGDYFTTNELIKEYPYTIDFENREEDSKWSFKQDGQTSKWYIGADTSHMVTNGDVNGGNAMYVSCDGGKSAHYDNTATSNSWAYRGVNLEKGTYTISFDWTCVGEKKQSVTGMEYNDYLRVVLLPSTSVFEAGTNLITGIDGSAIRFNTAKTTKQPTGSINLTDKVEDNVYVFNGVSKTKPLAEQWMTKTITFVVDEDMVGSYNMVFLWYNNSSAGDYANVRSAVVDNINILKESCDLPYNVQVVGIGEDYVELKWDILVNSLDGFNVKVEKAKADLKDPSIGDVVFNQLVNANTIKVTGLDANTQYKVSVQTVCDDTNVGKFTEPLFLTTLCASIAVDSILDFDNDAAHEYLPYIPATTTNKSYPTPKCFVVGHDFMNFTSSSVKYFPNIIGNTSTKKYSRSGNYALDFHRTQTTASGKDGSTLKSTEGGYIALPEFDGERENLQLSFWMRCFYSDSRSGKVGNGVSELDSRHSKKLAVGAMSDPTNPATFELITIVEYPYTDQEIKSSTLLTNDPTGNDYWIQAVIPLAGTEGKYIVLKNDIFGDSLKRNAVYVDDIKVSSVSCLKPSLIKFDDITTDKAVVSCVHSNVEKHIVKLATNEKFTENLRTEIVTGFPAELTGLQPSTIYYMQIQSLCSEEMSSSWSDVVSFTTDKTIAYTEEFEIDDFCPIDWQRANKTSSLEDLLGGANLYFVSPSAQDGWLVKPALFRNGLFSTSHMSVEVSCPAGIAGNVSKNWLVSPEVVLPNQQDLHLVFDLALTDMGTSEPIGADDLNAPASKFVVVISEDGGKTWKRENAVVWGGEAKDDYLYFDIPYTGKKYSIDLDRFAGKTIKVAFYTESAVDLNTTTEVHIDNVHINAYIKDLTNVDLCETEDYLNGDFYVHHSDLKVGENYFDDWVLADEKTEKDILIATTIKVSPMAEKLVTDSICEGDVYSKNNFSGIMHSGVYKQKLSSSTKCDSVVILDLSVVPAARVFIADTICAGQEYFFNGVQYETSGLYVDTLVSKVTGCDSIVSLALKVNDAIRVNQKMNICFGSSYLFGDTEITTSGSYTEEFESSKGCDSIVTLEAIVLPDYRRTITATIKDGEKYNENGFNGLSREGTYTLPLKSVDGCDSTITLNLVVLKHDTTYVENEITTADLPYEYESLYFDENTAPGTYIDTISVTIDGVDYIIIHKLIITIADALDDVMSQNLVIVPNPLRANQTLYIINDFTAEERIGLFVEMFDISGRRVLFDEPRNYPIAVDYLNQSGIYVVRIVTGTGDVYTGKVLFE